MTSQRLFKTKHTSPALPKMATPKHRVLICPTSLPAAPPAPATAPPALSPQTLLSQNCLSLLGCHRPPSSSFLVLSTSSSAKFIPDTPPAGGTLRAPLHQGGAAQERDRPIWTDGTQQQTRGRAAVLWMPQGCQDSAIASKKAPSQTQTHACTSDVFCGPPPPSEA